MKFILIALSFFIYSSAHANWLNSFKDPATLILNQNDCKFGKYPAEIIDGKVIIAGSRVSAILKKLDKNRITYENQYIEPKTTGVLIVEIQDGWIQAGYSKEKMFFGCKLK